MTSVTVVAADEQSAIGIDVERWAELARSAAGAEGGVGELTLTFVDIDEIAALNIEHMGGSGPTDVLSFPLDADGADAMPGGPPTMLGDIVICPEVAADNAADHAGTLDDELALLVVHGVLHVLGHDHAEPAEAEEMRWRELALLQRFHWGGEPPAGFHQLHRDDRT